MDCKQISKMEILNLRNTSVAFLKVSLKIPADVIAGRQIIQTGKKYLRFFMNEVINPPCKSLIATSFSTRKNEFNR